MIQSILSVLVFVICLAIAPQAIGEDDDLTNRMPGRETPRELIAIWLRFHGADLCLGLDASFSFKPDGVEIRGTIEDEKSAQRFEEMLAPFRTSHKIELTLAKPPEELKPDDKESKEARREKNEPPASLWENHELRSFLGDPIARAKEREGFEEESLLLSHSGNDMLKQRLFIYAEQTLRWNRKMERYAKDIPALTRVALDPAFPPELRKQASAVCRTHARKMERLIAKLNRNLEPAFPRSRNKELPPKQEKPNVILKTVIDRADCLFESARNVARRVYQFIHPEEHSVGLDELRRPSLLHSLKDLQRLDLEFEQALAKARP
jgi:hypothetical protein